MFSVAGEKEVDGCRRRGVSCPLGAEEGGVERCANNQPSQLFGGEVRVGGLEPAGMSVRPVAAVHLLDWVVKLVLIGTIVGLFT